MAAWSYRGVKQPIRVEAIWPTGSGDESWHENSNLAPSNSSVGLPTKVGSNCNQNSASLLVAIKSCWIWQAQDCLTAVRLGGLRHVTISWKSTSKNNTKSARDAIRGAILPWQKLPWCTNGVSQVSSNFDGCCLQLRNTMREENMHFKKGPKKNSKKTSGLELEMTLLDFMICHRIQV